MAPGGERKAGIAHMSRLAAARFSILLYSAEKNKKRVDKRVRAYGGRREIGK
jgi:hypothetical protein